MKLRFALLSVLALLCAANLFAQGGRYDTWAVDSNNHFVASPTVRVCSYSAPWSSTTAYVTGNTVTYNGGFYTALASSTNVTPGTDGTKWQSGNCSPLASIYTDKALTTAQANPFTGDAYGNYGWFAGAGTYTVQVNGYTYSATTAIDPSAAHFKAPPTGIATYAGTAAFGDSVVCGAGAGASDTCNSGGFEYLLAPDMGGTNSNFAVVGDMAADTSRKVLTNANPQYSRNPTYIVQVGINDSGRYTTNTAQRAMFQQFDTAILGWLAIPQQTKIFGQDGSIVKTGTWTNDDALRTGLEVSSTTQGSSLTFNLTTYGGPIYLAYHIIDSNGGTASVTIDGTPPAASSTLNAFGSSALATINGTTDSVAAVRYPVAAGTHTVVMTLTSTTGAGNKFEFSWAGTPPSQGTYFAPPRVLRGGVHRCQNDCNASFTSDFDKLAQVDVATVAGDGLNVSFVPIRNYINATTDMFDTYHPTAGGHRKLADAYEYVAQPQFAGLTSGSFPAPISVGGGSVTGPGQYNNFNTGNTVANATTWAAGVNFFDNFNNVYGLDFGYDTANSKNTTRRYAPANGEISDCFHTSGTLPTAQSDLVNCPYIATADGKVTMKIAVSTAPVQVASGTPTDPRNYNDLNSGDRLPSASTWAAGVTLFSNFSNIVAVDFGYDSVSTKVGPRVIMPANEEFCVGTHASGVQPANESDITCKFIVDGLAGAVSGQAASFTSLKVGANGSTLNTILTGTATLTYTAIAAQTCQEQPVTVTNSTTTNFGVSASPRATLGNVNLSWSAWVSAAGTVSVRVCNPTAGSITPSAVAWGVKVTQ
jgi:hypothetical protein